MANIIFCIIAVIAMIFVALELRRSMRELELPFEERLLRYSVVATAIAAIVMALRMVNAF
jgi:hypothetical protein